MDAQPEKTQNSTSELTPHLLIDTNILINLVAKDSYNYLLKKLVTLAEGGKVKLLVPDIMFEEWERNKKKRRGWVLKDIEGQKRRQIATMHERAAYTAAQLKRLEEILEEQLSDVDELLANGILISKSDELSAFIAHQQRNFKAPFHTNKKEAPIADAEIIYRSLNYCKEKGIKQLFFCTYNCTDFSTSTERAEELHKDFRESFPSVEIQYFRQAHYLLLRLDSMGFRIMEEPDEWMKETVDLEQPYIDRSLPILEQVFIYLRQVFEEVRIMPKAFFAERYPFLKNPKDHYEQAFTLVTDNEEVYKLLQIQVVDGIVNDPTGEFKNNEDEDSMIRFILRTLLENNISKVSIKNKPAIELVYSEKQIVCNCFQCLFQRLDWLAALKGIYLKEENSELSIREQMKQAYAKYRICDFKNSALQFEQIFQNPDTTPVLRYISAFNLIRLGKLLWYESSNESEVHDLSRRINAINLDEIKDESIYSKPLARRYIQWVHDRQFLTDAITLVNESESNVRDNYYAQNRGHNEYTINAIEIYGSTERALNLDFIVFDKFSEFNKLTKSYIELLYASYGSSKQMGGRLIHLSDHLLYSLVFKGEENTIRKYSRRYKIEDAVYFNSDSDNFQFISAIHRFLIQYNELANGGPGWKGYSYDNYLRNISLQIFQLLETLELSLDDWRTICHGLLVLFKHPEKIDFRLFAEMRDLLLTKGSKFESSFLEEMLELMLVKKELHSEELSYGISTELYKRGGYRLTDSLYREVLTKFVGECPDCKRDHSTSILVDLWILMNDKQRNPLKDLLTDQLKNNFVSWKYYRFVMNDIIDPLPEFNEQYLTQAYETISRQEPRPWFATPKDYADPRIDEYLNYCFKYEIQIPDSIAKILADKSNYYKWLLNPDVYDYAHFDEEWLGVHYTVHYKRRFRNSKRLQDFLLKSLKTRLSSIMERKYLQIYVLPLLPET